MTEKFKDRIEKAVIIQFPGADKRKITKFAEVMAEELTGKDERVVNNFLSAAPSLFAQNLSEQDIKSAVRIVNTIYKDDAFASLVGKISVEIIGKALKSTDEIFVSNFMRAGLMLKEKSPLGFLAYFSDDVVDGIIRNHLSPSGIIKWMEKIIEMTNDGKATDILLDYLTFDEDICKDIDFSQFKMQKSIVFYEEIAGELESLVRLHYNRRLNASKSVVGGAYTAEGDELRIFLPYYIDTMDTVEKNKNCYYILSDHEAGHIVYGSFRAYLPAFLDYLEKDLGKSIVVKKLEFADSTSMKLKSIVYEYNGKMYFANSLLSFISMFGDEYAPLLKDLWNCIEDGKIDAWWLDEKAYGMKAEYIERERVDGEKAGVILDYSITGIRNAILLFVCGYAGATDREKFVNAVFTGNVDGLSDDEKRIVEIIRATGPKTLEFLKKYSDELIMVISTREYHTTQTAFLTFKIVNDLKELVEKGEIEEPKEKEGEDGRVGGTGVVELDPENITFEIGEETQGVPLNELPEDIRKKFEDKLKKFLENLDKESKDKLMQRMGKRDEGKKGEVKFDRDTFVLEYDPNLGKTSPNLVVPIHLKKAVDCESMADAETVNKLSTIFKILSIPREEIVYGDEGEEIDTDRRYEWLLDKKRLNIIRDKDYYISRRITEMRDVALEIICDASGSTSGVINGRRVIDYLTEAVHTTVTALSVVPAIKFGYSFYNSNGPTGGTTIYVGKDIKENRIKYRRVEPDAANRDGAARRAMINKLLERKEPVKILLFFCDSLPADYNYENGPDDVRDARIEGEKKGVIQYTITVPVEKKNIPQFESKEKFYEHMYGEHYYEINSVRDLITAFETFFRSILPKLKTSRIIQ